jgi:4-amino-4-deoxy-L-arabinose transferase-like glycosyltransferase
MENRAATESRKSWWWIAGTIAGMAAALMVYAQTDAFTWDEGFHLLTAQLITRGERPYLDFVFPQTPLNAYWNALWMKLLGQTWRVPHAMAAIASSFAVLTISTYAFKRFPVERWRLPAGMLAALICGLNVVIFQYGSVGQAYGLALFLITAAFWVTVTAVDSRGVAPAFAAGLLSSAAAASTLLTAPVCPVLGIWMLLVNRAGRRGLKIAVFGIAAAIPFIPVAYLFAKSPQQTVFNILQYNLIFRQVEWPGAIAHDIGVMTSWLSSAQGFTLGGLGLAGLCFVRFGSGWQKKQRQEFYLCGWLALALCVHISSAHPTFARYYLFSVPFFATLATAGMYALLVKLGPVDQPFWPILALGVVFSLETARALLEKHDNLNWHDLERVVAKIQQVTPPSASVLGDEYVYFLTKRQPPSGTEVGDSHKLDFPPEKAKELHLMPETEELKQLKEGRYATAADCDKGHKIGADDFKKLYRHKWESDSCNVYWDLIR